MTVKDLSAGDKAPAFTLLSSDREKVSLANLKGSWIVLYFYPKDSTSGCTLEANDFTAQLSKFRKLGAEVLGVSPDSPESHCLFRDTQKLKITLLSDGKKTVLEKYSVWKQKSMYGKKYMGVERSTFLISPAGKIVKIWRKVKVPGHVNEVLNVLKDAPE